MVAGGLGFRLAIWMTWSATPVAAIMPTIIVYICSVVSGAAAFEVGGLVIVRVAVATPLLRTHVPVSLALTDRM